MWTRVAIFLCMLAAIGIPDARAQAPCEPDRAPAERAVDCLEFAARRFRIPAGYFVPWVQPDDAGKLKLAFPAGKTDLSYFLIGAALPDLAPVPELVEVRRQENFQPPQATAESEKRGVVAVVNLSKNLRIATRIEPLGGDWVFASSTLQVLLASGCKADDAPNAEPLTIRCAGNNDTFRLFRREGRIAHFILEAPGREEYVCVVPYAADVYLSVNVTDDLRADICAVGYRLRDKLRSFEY